MITPRTSSPGMLSLGLASIRDTQRFVPSAYTASRPATLIDGRHAAPPEMVAAAME